MSVEGGSIGTAGGAGIEGGLAARFGPEMGAVDIGPIVNEGPVGFTDMKNTMPLQIGQKNPITEISFQPQPALNAADVMAEAESILAQVKIPEPKEVLVEPLVSPKLPFWEVIVPREMLQVEPMIAPWVLPMVEPAVEAQPKLHPAIQTESRISPARIATQSVAGGPAVLPQPLPEEQEEKEEVVTQKVDKEEDIEGEEEEVAMKKKIHMVDKPVLTTVLSETSEAIEKAKKEAERLGLGRKIIGSIVAKLLPSQHEGNTGGAVKPHGVDGTIIARKEAIAGKQEFSSEKEVVAVILENRPVTIGEDGDSSTQKEVDTTYQGRVVKPPKVIQIVEIRRKKMVEKRAQVPVRQETTLPARETNLKELNPLLAEALQKAA